MKPQMDTDAHRFKDEPLKKTPAENNCLADHYLACFNLPYLRLSVFIGGYNRFFAS